VSISDDGNVVAIGAPGAASGAGNVRVFSFDSGNNAWVQIANNIDAEAANDESVILFNTTINFKVFNQS
jgi:hypothetical protein